MVTRIHGSRLVLLFVLLSFSLHELGAQTPTNTEGETRPTPRDPRYSKTMVPPSLKPKEDSSTDLILDPTGSMNLETFVKRRRSQELNKRKGEADLLERELQTVPEGERERIHLERSIMRQFGVDDFPHGWRKQGTYEETPARRFQVVYFLSLPFTMLLSYGVVSLSQQSRGGSGSLNGDQTAAIFGSGLLLSGFIGWYDYRKIREDRISESGIETEAQDATRFRSDAIPGPVPLRRNFSVRFTGETASPCPLCPTGALTLPLRMGVGFRF